MKNQIDRELIEELGKGANVDFVNKINNTVFSLIETVISDLSEKTAFVSLDRCVLIPVNEICTGALSQISEYTYFLGIHNSQIEANSTTRKNFWRNLWTEFKAAWRLGKKKYKARKKEKVDLSMTGYRITDFRHDLVNTIANHISSTSIVYEYSRHFTIVGIDDFGTNVKINVYVTCYDKSSNTFKLYDERRTKFRKINFDQRFENIDYKSKETKKGFVTMLTIFNSIFARHYNRVANQILMESLIFNCPNSLFSDDIYASFVNVANYIRLADPASLVSISTPSKTIFEDQIITSQNSHADFGKVVSMLDRFVF